MGVDYLNDILQKPYSSFPVLNSAGNIVGMMPKNFLIVLIENHHWIDMNKLTGEQVKELKKLYFGDFDEDSKKVALDVSKRVFKDKTGTVGPQDWYLKEFSKHTLAYFKDNQSMIKKLSTFTKEEKDEVF